MTTLRVRLGEQWPDMPEAQWALLDGSGRLLRTGEGEPRHWPPAQKTEAVLDGPQTSWLKVRVPRASVREQAQALGFALEELLVREADSQHITPSLKGEEAWSVLVVARERLKRLQAQFEAISRPLDAAFAIQQSLPAETDAWAIAASGASLIVRSEEQGGWVEDLTPEGSVPGLLASALHSAKEAGNLPARLVFRGEKGSLNLEEWENVLGLGIETGKTWAWFDLPRDASNLLHDEFQPRHRRHAWQKALRPALIGLVLVLGLQTLLGTGYAWWRRAEAYRIKSEMAKLLRTQLPNNPVQDPPLQILQELNRQREQHRQLPDDSMISLLTDFSLALGGDANELLVSASYHDKTLDIAVLPEKIDDNRLKTSLETRGLSLTPREGKGHFTLRRSR